MSSAATSTAPSRRKSAACRRISRTPSYATAIGLIRYAQILETERAAPPGVLRQNRPHVLAVRHDNSLNNPESSNLQPTLQCHDPITLATPNKPFPPPP